VTAADLSGLLRAVYACRQALADAHAAPMLAAMQSADITTPARVAHWLAQIGHESGRLRYTREIWGPSPAQKRYEPHTTLSATLGNIRAGDGFRYRGRGLIQTTGRENYRSLTRRIRSTLGAQSPDFEAAPQLLETIDWAAWSAADYWRMRNLNKWADAGDLYGLTRRVNGGTNGIADRKALHIRASMAIKGG